MPRDHVCGPDCERCQAVRALAESHFRLPPESDIPITDAIEGVLVCARCLHEVQVEKARGVAISLSEYSRMTIGWTKIGLQVWCQRHRCNIVHIDFEGSKHPVNTGSVTQVPIPPPTVSELS